MTSSRIAPYGSWKSDITVEKVAAQSLSAGIEDIILDLATGKVYYGQLRPEEGGRSAFVDAITGKDLFGPQWDARTRVHEYGGGAATVHDGVLFFSHFGDNRVYRAELGKEPEPITPVNAVLRFADFTVHPVYTNLVVATVEDHTDPHPSRVLNYLVVIDANESTVTKLVSGADFYACARFSPDGKHITWQQWRFPELPWQSSEIRLASITVSAGGNSMSLSASIHVAGEHTISAAQDPTWTCSTSLHFVIDISGYSNPWMFSFDPTDFTLGTATPILPHPIEEEFGVPQWWLTRHGSGALDQDHIAFIAFRGTPVPILYIADIRNKSLIEVPTPYSNIQYLHGDGKGKVVALGQPVDRLQELFELSLDRAGQPIVKALGPSTQNPPSALPHRSSISLPQFYTLKLTNDRPCYVTYLPPKSSLYDGGLPVERPPVIVLVHGGPFFMESIFFDLTKQFWTSRGWAHVDVQFGGSTGFGRAFRETLHGNWGVLDVQDSYESVLELDKMGLVDAKRATIYGGSGGGYTTLQAAATLPNAFVAGAALYGISDMKKLDDVLHKFEYHLCERLMGGPYDKIPEVWKERSPIFHADKIKMPLLVLQGSLDPVVPVQQMADMVKAIQERDGKAELVLFEKEGHGFREAATIKAQLIKQLEFFNEAIGVKNSV